MVNQLQFTNPQAYSGGADFTPLANLGNVYQAAQDRARQQAALAQLGPDLEMNSRALISSGVPGLAQLGLNLQQSALNRQREDARNVIVDARLAEAEKRAGAHLTIAQEQARRVQEEYDKKAADEAEAAKLLAGLGGRGAGTGPSPFPAPLPGAPAQGVPTPPTMAADETALPAWASPVAMKVTSNLVSNQPGVAPDISREQLADLYRNPITRDLATAYLKKQVTPDEWTYHVDNDSGRVTATSKTDPSKTKFITPGDGAGADTSKEQRARDLRYADAIKRGYNEDTANYYALNSKLPKEDRSPTETKLIDTTTNAIDAADAGLSALEKATASSEKAFQGVGAGALGTVFSNLPGWVPGHEAGVATRVLENQQLRAALGQLQAAFGRNPSNREDAIMIKLQGAVNEPIEVRRQIFQDAKEILAERRAKEQRKLDQMQSGEYFKRGMVAPTAAAATAGAEAPPPAPSVPAAAATVKPSLGDFMKRARDANPGYTDSEIAAEWKKRYGS